MLTEKRQAEIIKIVHQQGSVTVSELCAALNASESTIRRDLNALDQKGELSKVFGGAVRTETSYSVKEELVANRISLNSEEKQRIGRYAAGLIEANDFIYLDAGTTTAAMLPFITEKSASFVTNAVSHALVLSRRSFHVILIGGELKTETEAIVGSEAYEQLSRFHFTKSFMGVNGIHQRAGLTTPDPNEALIKKCVVSHSKNCFILADAEKFHCISPVRFADLSQVHILTDRLPNESFYGEARVTIVP